MSLLKNKFILNNEISNEKLLDKTILGGKIADDTLDFGHLTTAAVSSLSEAALQSKILASRVAVTGISASGGSVDVTTGVTAVSKTGVNTVVSSSVGMWVGSVSNAADVRKVHVRAAGTDNGIPDGNSDEIYGVLSFATDVYTVNFFKADGTAFSFAEATNVDLFLVEYATIDDLSPEDLLLLGGVSGVIDATQASAINALVEDLASTANGEGASLIGVEDALDNFTATTVEGVLAELAAEDSLIATNMQTLVQDEADARVAADDALDVRVTALEAKAPQAELITLDSTMITNKSFTLSAKANNYAAIILFPLGGLPQAYSIDFTASDAGDPLVTTISWTGLGMDLLGLVAGDQIKVIYFS